MSNEAANTIPPLLHFVWFGARLPSFAQLAIASALAHNQEARAILWHGPELQVDSNLHALTRDRLELRQADALDLLSDLAEQAAPFDTMRLAAISKQLTAPAARSNILRLLVLFMYGGIYLDTDTLCLRELSPLLKHRAFCGLEHILWPAGTSKLNPKALLLGETRRLCGAIPGGQKLHRHLLPYYSTAANNAVLGFAKHSPAAARLLQSACAIPEKDWSKRFRFGTHLLQNELIRQEQEPANSDRITALPPDAFYPVGPIISRHYLRKTHQPKALSQELISPRTFVIHWYASVGQLLHRDAQHIRNHAKDEVFSYLSAPYLNAKGGSGFCTDLPL